MYSVNEAQPCISMFISLSRSSFIWFLKQTDPPCLLSSNPIHAQICYSVKITEVVGVEDIFIYGFEELCKKINKQKRLKVYMFYILCMYLVNIQLTLLWWLVGSAI